MLTIYVMVIDHAFLKYALETDIAMHFDNIFGMNSDSKDLEYRNSPNKKGGL